MSMRADTVYKLRKTTIPLQKSVDHLKSIAVFKFSTKSIACHFTRVSVWTSLLLQVIEEKGGGVWISNSNKWNIKE